MNSSLAAVMLIIERYRAEATKYGTSGIVAMNRKVAIGSCRKYVEERWLPQALDFFREFPALGAVFDDKVFMKKLMSGKTLGLDDVPDDQFVAGTPNDWH